MRFLIELLNKREKEIINEAAFKVLEKTGVGVHSTLLLRLLQERGAAVDFKRQSASLPRSLVEEAVRRQNKVPLPGPDTAMPQFVMGSEMKMIDYTGKTSRRGTIDDCLKNITLGNSLDHIDVVSTGVIPSAEVPTDVIDITCYELLFKYSAKPVFSWIYSPHSATAILEMATIAGDGDPAKIGLLYLAEPVSPLQYSAHTLEILTLFAAENLPVRFAPMVLAGASGPATIAGTAVLQWAEILAGLTLLYALDTKSPAAVTAAAHMLDMSSGVCLFGPPEQSLLTLAVMEVARDYNLAVSANLGLTDANCPDFQAGFEKAFSTALAIAAGAYKIGMQGIVGADNGFSPQQLVIDNEWAGWIKRIIQQGITVTEDTIALDVIRQVGIGGSFLEGEALAHTNRHFRQELQSSRLFNRRLYEQWLKEGARDTATAAAEALALMNRSSPVPHLDDIKLKEIEAVAARAKSSSKKH